MSTPCHSACKEIGILHVFCRSSAIAETKTENPFDTMAGFKARKTRLESPPGTSNDYRAVGFSIAVGGVPVNIDDYTVRPRHGDYVKCLTSIRPSNERLASKYAGVRSVLMLGSCIG